MAYKLCEYPQVGPGKYYYIKYENLERTRAGNKVWKPRVKRVYISGKLLRWQKGRVRKRTGETVNGIKLIYENTRKGFKAQRGNTRYSVSRAEMEVAKVVELPKGARNIRLTTSKREAQPTLMEVR